MMWASQSVHVYRGSSLIRTHPPPGRRDHLGGRTPPQAYFRPVFQTRSTAHSTTAKSFRGTLVKRLKVVAVRQIPILICVVPWSKLTIVLSYPHYSRTQIDTEPGLAMGLLARALVGVHAMMWASQSVHVYRGSSLIRPPPAGMYDKADLVAGITSAAEILPKHVLNPSCKSTPRYTLHLLNLLAVHF